MSRALAELRELAALTSDAAGAQRLAWTETWETSRAWFEAKCQELGLGVLRDEAGNQWAVLPGREETLLAVGGHLDSVPNGGWLDGCLNVVAGLEVLRDMAADGPPAVSVALVNWADEEGARFGRSLFGSSAAAGRLDVAAVRDLRDGDGLSLERAVAAYGVEIDRAGESRQRLAGILAYLELHIEQGPVLESLGLPLGAVLGTFGVRRNRVTFAGQAGHAGATPMDRRRDALLAGAALTLAVREVARSHGGVGTVGEIRVQPGTPTIVAGVCEVAVDLRHLDVGQLDAMLKAAVQASMAAAGDAGVEVSWSALYSADPAPFNAELIGICEAAAKAEAGSCHRLPSGPLHDATSMAQAGIPTGMIFVRSLRGLSHCKEEDSSPEDLELAIRTLKRAARSTVEWILARPNS